MISQLRKKSPQKQWFVLISQSSQTIKVTRFELATSTSLM